MSDPLQKARRLSEWLNDGGHPWEYPLPGASLGGWEIARLLAHRMKALEAALQFYANSGTWAIRGDSEMTFSLADDDEGEIARQALRQEEEKGEHE